MRRNHSIAWVSAALIVIIVIAAGCQQQDQNRLTAPGSASDLANFYSSRGLGTGEIGGYVRQREFVLNLPAGHWRVTYYTMPDGNEYTKYVVLDQESLCYVGTHSGTVVQVEVEQGEFTDDGSSMPLSNAQRLFSSGSFRGRGGDRACDYQRSGEHCRQQRHRRGAHSAGGSLSKGAAQCCRNMAPRDVRHIK